MTKYKSIAAGKTTLLSNIQKHFPHQVVRIAPEPIQTWENVTNAPKDRIHLSLDILNDTKPKKQPRTTNETETQQEHEHEQQYNLLSQMYSNPNRWCFSFQLWALYTRILSIEQTINEMKQLSNETASATASSASVPVPAPDILLIERSAYANRIFASIMFENGYLNECEWQMYNHFFEYFAKTSPKMHGIIYLSCDVSTAMTRIKHRNRNGEEFITDAYLQSIADKHKVWIEWIQNANASATTNTNTSAGVCDFIHSIDLQNSANKNKNTDDPEIMRGIVEFLQGLTDTHQSQQLSGIDGNTQDNEYNFLLQLKELSSEKSTAAVKENII